MNQHLPTITEFVMEASDAESMAQSLNLPSVLHLLPHLVHSAKSLARPPISNFHVAAVGLGSDGRLFIGVNLEFPGVPLHHSVHAEQFLLTNLALHRCPRLLSLAVSAAPCAHCRQFFQELRHSSSLQILITNQENRGPNLEYKTPNFNPLSKILPIPFGPYDLLDKETPLLLEQHKNGLYLSLQIETPIEENCGEFCNENREITKLSNGYCENLEKNEIFLREAALEAANNSHAPYSRCPSGVALMDCEGKVYTGSYAESAAYNPSLGPVQAAIVAYIAGGGGGYERIVSAVLVEKEGAKVRQEDTARLLLKAVSPECEFRVFRCEARLGSI